MAVRNIVIYPEGREILRAQCAPVGRITRRVENLVRDLKETLAAHNEGIGLAAPQIGITSRVVVVRLGGGADEGTPGPPLPLINPEILEARDEQRDFDGCLSLPGLYGQTARPHFLRVAGLDETGCPFEDTFEGFDAVVVHHELDHLDGVLFIDRVACSEDLYRVQVRKDGRRVRVPLTQSNKDSR